MGTTTRSKGDSFTSNKGLAMHYSHTIFSTRREADLVSTICGMFHRENEELITYQETPFLTEDIDLGKRVARDAPSEIRGLQEVVVPSKGDYLEYGDGVPNGDSYSEDELLGFIEALSKRIDWRMERAQAIYVETRAKCDKAASASYFVSFKSIWKQPKVEMAKLRKAAAEDRTKMANCWGEIRARNATSNPTNTTYFTSDMEGPASVAPEGFEEEYDTDLHGMYAKANRGDVTTRCLETEKRLAEETVLEALAPVYVTKKVTTVAPGVIRRIK